MMLLWAALTSPSAGQAAPSPLAYGQVTTARIDNRSPLQRYVFDGLRGEFVRATLTVTDGGLDAVLVLSDPDGVILLVRDDDFEAGKVSLAMRLPRSGPYTLTAARFGYAYGTTVGSYRLQIDRLGVSAESGSGLRFGDTVANLINDETPEVYYSFRARQGELITLAMRRDGGTLDPFLRIVDANRTILVEADDWRGTPDARVERWQVPADGQYLIVATRYGGPAGKTSGQFLLTLDKIPDSALGSSADLAIQLSAGQPTERDLSAGRYELWYSFEASAGQRVTLSLQRVNGNLDPYLVLLSPDLRELIAHDDIVDGRERDSLIENFPIPADGKYYVLATRFERAAGTTIGRFRLTLTLSR
jgi:hypothetical protein